MLVPIGGFSYIYKKSVSPSDHRIIGVFGAKAEHRQEMILGIYVNKERCDDDYDFFLKNASKIDFFSGSTDKALEYKIKVQRLRKGNDYDSRFLKPASFDE